MRIATDGKFFSRGRSRFDFRGVTYGTFEPRSEDGARVPVRGRIKRDFAAMDEAGFTVVRTYTEPPDDLIEIAADTGLAVLAGFFHSDWRYLVGAGRREQARIAREARRLLRPMARRLAGSEQTLAICVGNEIPADVVRWVGTDRVASTISSLCEVVREEDDAMLVTYANYPTTEYLPLDDLDFLTFNVFLERRTDFRRYLTRLHHLAGDRPVVLGELGLDSRGTPDGERRQAGFIDWQLETAVERGVAGTCVFSFTDDWHVGESQVEGWHFGLTRADRSPRPALDVAAAWNGRSVRDLHESWPRLSVVVCAYNAEATVEECLRHTCALDYPSLEILLVDDGSTDSTAEIARRFPEVRLVEIPHGGLSVARNEGYAAASGDIVAYLDSDAYPTREWPYYLALAFDGPTVGGAGGPNVPPRDDPRGAQQVALAPGGPVHVLTADDRAEHVPGCNMAFLRGVLAEVGGCDPVYTAAGDDVDLCWKVLDRGYEIGFHPAALVWHHRRAGLRPYLRQQRGYGRAESLVAGRHPERFTGIGTARWKGRIYTPVQPVPFAQRIYRGVYGSAAYQSVYMGGGHGVDIAHQVGVPIAVGAALTAPAAVYSPLAGGPAAAGTLFLAALFALDVFRARPPRHVTRRHLSFRAGVAWMHLLQPVARVWGRGRSSGAVRRSDPAAPLPGPAQRVRRRQLLVPAAGARDEMVASLVSSLRRTGVRFTSVTGWEDHDGRFFASLLVWGELVTGAFPEGAIQIKVRPRPRWRRVAVAVAVVAAGAAVAPAVAGCALAVASVDVGVATRRIAVTVPRRIGNAFSPGS